MWKQLLRVRDKAVIKCGGIESLMLCISSCYENSIVHLSKLYSTMSPVTNKVPWFYVVWENFSYPKHCFILWLAVQNRLLIKERLLKRGLIQAGQCCLCEDASLETRDHLFFECRFSVAVWNGVMSWLRFNWKTCNWGLLIFWYSSRLRGKGFRHKIKRMALSTTVYILWKKRNARVFKQKRRSVDQSVTEIKIDILSITLNSSLPADEKDWLLSL
ncbi:uncharacterized protein LOC109844683 [Asparagus officinalis]|uniref:uncharacterized protein LOC109838145 n=1 Tax=Asparagus officinalis TaxID=4686 RepID=UPI00098E8375|nr:uncharacterized protein LOC109838145 [Asparagus officinalis]XP_020269388.1 uncharacterized protein LOC109844683 [Asparagus officinalis]